MQKERKTVCFEDNVIMYNKMRTNRKNRIKIARRSNCADKSSQRVKSVCLLWATARTCSVARSTSGNTTPPTMRNTRYPRKRWRTRSSPPSSRRRRSTSATPTSGAAALPLLHSTAPASSATSTTTAAWAGASAGWARRDCASSVRGCPPPMSDRAIWCSSKAPTTRRAHPMWAFTSATT